jgi:hypothetical protein
MSSTIRALLVCLALAGASTLSRACDLCIQAGQPLSREVKDAKLVVFGPIANAKLGADGISGTSELRIDATIKSDPQLGELKSITLPHFVPPDPKVKYLIFADARRGQLDPYRGIPFNSDRVVRYLKDSPEFPDDKAPPEKRAQRLLYYFKYLNDPEPDLALDAFKEWAGAGNREVGLVAPQVSADDLRQWLMNPKTPANRLSLYAFLLGSAGKDSDAELLRRLIVAPDERTGSALDGLLAGYIRLRPEEGWKLTEDVITDPKRPFTQKHAILRLLRFYHGYQPAETRAQIVKCSALMLQQQDVHDLMVDQLHAWKIWDLTDQVIAVYAKADAPITKRAVCRYLVLCPQPQAKKFLEQLRQMEPKLVRDVEEYLRGEPMQQ